ncbi:MAG: ketopantoate reductase family protein [Spirochaetaceae bacterium]|jgi:2-dehydropantoate 2-reductase|nr:ketopantoate reductase family protein [Spirochaetaceae bacterium]
MQINSVLIAGAGSVGLTVACQLYTWNKDCPTLLATGDRYKGYAEKGIWVNNKRIDFQLTGDIDSGLSENVPAYDLIIIACKSYSLDNVITEIKPFVGDNTIIISLINGISSEEIIGRVYGREKLPLAMIIATDAQREILAERGCSIHYTQTGIINFGGHKRDEEIAAFFTRAGIPFAWQKDKMLRTMWYKFMINAGINQTSAILRLPYGAFKKASAMYIPEADAILHDAMAEVIALSPFAAKAAGESWTLGEDDIAEWEKALSNLKDTSYTSMAQDVLAGRQTEAELFGKTVCELGEKYGVPTPVNKTLYREIRTIDNAPGRL